MSIDKLQNQVRKLKNPTAVYFSLDKTQIPPQVLSAETDPVQAYQLYAKRVLDVLTGMVPAVRFGFGSFALNGSVGLNILSQLLTYASKQGYYVVLDVPEIFSFSDAKLAADAILGDTGKWKCDGLMLSCYIGSDAIKPFADKLKESEMDLFLSVRTGNKSAPELQELLTGSRSVCTVAADMVKRMGEGFLGRCGYSRIAGVGPATSADTLRMMREKYTNMFLWVDGYDYSGANAKNCSFAFDNLGHGAVVCASDYILAAWKNALNVNDLPEEMAYQAAERIKKNISRYITIL